ncbi:hypothetical protein SARC_05774 [Sphaeroforma arctica JP610]|uniref:CID domain-containing protein n=1 Tax=Sphaeroforma arctica JP610 TaxID=667725 RepID=A0A0L0G151_9EUKA|nr:hypothetical protein SARC_05774 [Sphaeroforma arctica JP610]KNC81923.1 hypothetical protein SARC_05774 [Sphaeroforma arctica JP610]|eukprot:XP_014155825.1 hypothetical protein SARC_05774 [Sphaeroforma arctica JP610]
MGDRALNLFIRQYERDLANLRVNSKPIIDQLTLAADDNRQYAQALVEAIKDAIFKASPKFKLPLMYLIDSILKNVQGPYIHLFSRDIVYIFTDSYFQLEEREQRNFERVRATWGDVFGRDILDDLARALDRRNGIERRNSHNVHINPKFEHRKSIASRDAYDQSERSSRGPVNDPRNDPRGLVNDPRNDPRDSSARSSTTFDPRDRARGATGDHQSSRDRASSRDYTDNDRRSTSSQGRGSRDGPLSRDRESHQGRDGPQGRPSSGWGSGDDYRRGSSSTNQQPPLQLSQQQQQPQGPMLTTAQRTAQRELQAQQETIITTIEELKRSGRLTRETHVILYEKLAELYKLQMQQNRHYGIAGGDLRPPTSLLPPASPNLHQPQHLAGPPRDPRDPRQRYPSPSPNLPPGQAGPNSLPPGQGGLNIPPQVQGNRPQHAIPMNIDPRALPPRGGPGPRPRPPGGLPGGPNFNGAAPMNRQLSGNPNVYQNPPPSQPQQPRIQAPQQLQQHAPRGGPPMLATTAQPPHRQFSSNGPHYNGVGNVPGLTVPQPVVQMLQQQNMSENANANAGSSTNASAESGSANPASALFSKLLEFGMIQSPQVRSPVSKSPVLTSSTVAPSGPPPQGGRVSTSAPLPTIEFNTKSLNERHQAIISSLYETLPLQCAQCGLRFKPDHNAEMGLHLDWHFRMNKREKEQNKKPTARRWYPAEKDWMEYEEVGDGDEEPATFFDQSIEEEKEEVVVEVSIRAGPNDTAKESVCNICGGSFEKFWNDDDDSWHYRGAIREDDATYHKSCYSERGESTAVISAPASPRRLSVYKTEELRDAESNKRSREDDENSGGGDDKRVKAEAQ